MRAGALRAQPNRHPRVNNCLGQMSRLCSVEPVCQFGVDPEIIRMALLSVPEEVLRFFQMVAFSQGCAKPEQEAGRLIQGLWLLGQAREYLPILPIRRSVELLPPRIVIRQAD